MTQKDDLGSNALVKGNNKGLMTSKSRRSQISLTSDIIRAATIARTLSQTLIDESWMQEIWGWADSSGIHELQVPRNREKLLKLTSLDISCNQLRSLPESIFNLTNLTSLNIGLNRLSELPESIGNLTNLTSLNIGTNGLKQLPESIGNLTNLTSLKISNNPFTGLYDNMF